MNRENIEGTNYIVVNDSELKELIHPCLVCECDICLDLPLRSCDKRKVHYVLEINESYYKTIKN